MSERKLCKDCMWCLPQHSGWIFKKVEYNYAQCCRPYVEGDVNAGHTLVTGKPLEGRYCKLERNDYTNSCGPKGKYFKPWETLN